MVKVGRPVGHGDHGVEEGEGDEEGDEEHPAGVVHLVARVRIELVVHLAEEEVVEAVEEGAALGVEALVS